VILGNNNKCTILHFLQDYDINTHVSLAGNDEFVALTITKLMPVRNFEVKYG
jgi:hypothetical protein